MSATSERSQLKELAAQFGDELHARWLKERAAQEMYEALDAIVDSATDGRDIPGWLKERLVPAALALTKAEGKL